MIHLRFALDGDSFGVPADGSVLSGGGGGGGGGGGAGLLAACIWDYAASERKAVRLNVSINQLGAIVSTRSVAVPEQKYRKGAADELAATHVSSEVVLVAVALHALAVKWTNIGPAEAVAPFSRPID